MGFEFGLSVDIDELLKLNLGAHFLRSPVQLWATIVCTFLLSRNL